jgi:hypothetical protein
MYSKSVEDLLPNLRAQARLWTTSIALETPIEQAATRYGRHEECLSDLLVTARDIHLGTAVLPCQKEPAGFVLRQHQW